MRTLLLAFSVTPLRKLPGLRWLGRHRRMVGLFAFTYVLLHLLAYLFFYIEFSWVTLVEDFSERTYITAGIVAALCLVPMAITSTLGWRRRLGTGWIKLHRLIYPALGAAVLHVWWLTRDGFGEPLLYVVWFAALVLAPYRLSGRST